MKDVILILMFVIVAALYFFANATVAKVALNLVIIFIFIMIVFHQRKLRNSKLVIFSLVVLILWVIMFCCYLTTL